MNDLERLFAEKQTENGDATYNTTGNKLLLSLIHIQMCIRDSYYSDLGTKG